jgi:glycosyltransferase involved in cell wall biosynthesis
VFTDHRQVGFPLSRRHELMVRLIADRIDLVIAVTPAQCDGWRKRGYPAERVVVVPNGVEAHDVPQSKAAIRRVIGLSDDHVVATVVASMRPEKCIPDVVTALLRVHRTRPELIGVIVGDGPDRPSVVRAVGDTTAVRLLGHRDDVPRILKASDMLVLASRFEAVPMAILEAMAAGLPVIATDVGGVRDIVENGVTGFLVPATARGQLVSRLEQLVGDPALRGRMGRAGVCRYQEVGDAEAMVDRYARALADGAKRI